MANICWTSWLVYGPKESVDKFNDIIVEAQKEKKSFKEIENRWGRAWLGNLYLAAGYPEKDVLGTFDIRCRGAIAGSERVSGIKKYGEGVSFDTETAWEPFAYSIEKLLTEKFPDLSMIYCAEEPGFEIYINTDEEEIYFPDRYIARFVKGDDEHSCYYGSKDYENMIRDISEFIKRPGDEIKKDIKNNAKNGLFTWHDTVDKTPISVEYILYTDK